MKILSSPERNFRYRLTAGWPLYDFYCFDIPHCFHVLVLKIVRDSREQLPLCAPSFASKLNLVFHRARRILHSFDYSNFG